VKKPRFRLRADRDKGQWCIDRGLHAPQTGEWRWTCVSIHFTLTAALVYAQEHLLLEGYTSSGGVDRLLHRMNHATVLIEGWARELSENLGAELEAP
jgi:hypothetical protein